MCKCHGGASRALHGVHFDRPVTVILVLILMFWCLNCNAPSRIRNCRLYLRPQSLLTVITYDLQLFKKVIKLFPISIITAIALLLDHHLTCDLAKTGTCLQCGGSTCIHIIILSKIAHQMWCNHPLSQKNRRTERTARMGVLGDREVGRGGKNLKKEGQAIQGVFIKQGANREYFEILEIFLSMKKETIKNQ